MVSILKRQQVNNRFPRYLGADVEVAHKTGDGQPWVANDAGILYAKTARYPEAKELFEKVLEVYPNSYSAALNLKRLETMQKRK